MINIKHEEVKENIMSENQLSAGIRLEGEVTLTVRDAKTLEVKREYIESNTVTGILYHRWLREQPIISGSPTPDGIYLSNRKLSPVLSANKIGQAYARRDTILLAPTFFVGSPDYMETKQRFNAPPSTRTINTIFIGQTDAAFIATGNSCVAYAPLSTPCTQTTTEVLDVTYRIQALYAPYSSPGFPISDEFGRSVARGILVSSTGLQYRYPAVAERLWCKVPPLATYHTSVPISDAIFTGSNSQSVFSAVNSHGKVLHTITKAALDEVGKIYQCIAYGSNDSNGFGTNSIVTKGSIAWARAVPSSFTGSGKPIQPIHNHSANAVSPFLDVDFLSSSQGFITVFGAGWTDPDYPEFYRLEYQNTGELATARYFFRHRNILGFDNVTPLGALDPSYRTANEGLVFMMEKSGVKTHITGGYGLIPGPSKVEYNTRKIVLWALNGVTVQDIVDNTTASFDSTSSPALPCTAIRQVCVDDSGSVWVACASAGLYKITAPFGVATITHFTNAVHGIPVGGDTASYATTPGFGSSVWAVFNGALSRTDNGGTSWTNYSPSSIPIFTYTGITNSLWVNVKYMEADRNSPDHQLSLIADNQTGSTPGTNLRNVWWSVTTATAVTGVLLDDYIHCFKCSRRGSLWLYKATTFDGFFKINYGASSGTEVTQTGGSFPNAAGDFSKPSFLYDYYNVPYVMSSGLLIHFAVYNADTLKLYDDLAVYSNSSTNGAAREASLVFEEDPRGLIISRAEPIIGGIVADITYGYNIFSANPKNVTAIPGTIPDPLNGRYSPFEEFVWRRYHWNGSSWLQNYYAVATDTSVGGVNHGARHNFDTEDHTFTGRSLIDATTVFDASVFANPAIATFAFRVIPTAKFGATLAASSRQEFRRTLLSIEDVTQKFRVHWSNSDTASIGSIVIEHGATNTVVVATPAESSTNRIVVTVNGTTCKVYNNGVQVGSTITLSSTFNFTNTSGTLKCHVGASVYPDYQKYAIAPTWFYKGVMTNVQFWNVEWSAANVTEDFGIGGGTGVIAGQPAANQKARYELTQSLVGLETKVTHSSTDALLNGLTLNFSGAAGTDFVAGDYLTWGVVDGILKDNATSFSQQFSLYLRPAELNFTEFKNGVGATTISASTTTMTERAVWSLDRQTDLTFGAQATDLNSRPGEIACNKTGFVGAGLNVDNGGITTQGIPGNGYIQFKVTSSDETSAVGLTDNPIGLQNATELDYGLHFVENGTVNIRQLDVIPSGGTGITTYVAGDEFKVERVGTTVTYYKITGGPTLLYTSLVSSSGTLYGKFIASDGTPISNNGSSIFNTIINYVRPGYFMTVGNFGTSTGSFHPEFLRVETNDHTSGVPTNTSTITISLNAVPISPSNILISNTYQGAMTVPGPGQVVINGETGWLVFNSADVGATVTGSVNVIFNKLP